MAGAAGIEPANADTKNRCLTAWRRPNTSVSRVLKGTPLPVKPLFNKSHDNFLTATLGT